MRRIQHVASLALLLCALAAASPAAVPDAWITTKAKIKLLTAADVSLASVAVDTQDGLVTLHGSVGSQAEKARAAQVVRAIDGVREVHNLLQVVPESRRDLVKEADEAIRTKVSQCLGREAALKDVKVASVNDGVVLLSGETDEPGDELRAIEAVRSCTSVRRVASEIRTRQP